MSSAGDPPRPDRPDPEQATHRAYQRTLAEGDPTAWFEPLYAAAERGEAELPWHRDEPHPLLVRWGEARRPTAVGRRAVVVGCGLGDDAEYVARLGYDTVAFDVSPTAVATARRRFPHTRVHYRTADLLRLPARWDSGYDLVVEVRTVQSLPEPARGEAIAAVGRLVAPGGVLLVVAAAQDEADEPVAGPPWPLTREEIDAFTSPAPGRRLHAVTVEEIADVRDGPEPAPRLWWAEFHRP